MKQVLSLMILYFTLLCTRVSAQDSGIFPRGEIGRNTDNYTGTIWLNELSQPDSNFTFSVAAATYSQGSKLNWHIHPGGQILLITEGTGYYQEKGKSAQIIHKGDVIKCPPGVVHWHAAAPKSSFAYVAISPSQKGRTVWLQKVTDEEYNSVK